MQSRGIEAVTTKAPEREIEEKQMSRFDYVHYDAISMAKQADAKDLFTEVETAINTLADGRAKSLALTKLEETYMWVGKAIRDEQIARIRPPAGVKS